MHSLFVNHFLILWIYRLKYQWFYIWVIAWNCILHRNPCKRISWLRHKCYWRTQVDHFWWSSWCCLDWKHEYSSWWQQEGICGISSSWFLETTSQFSFETMEVVSKHVSAADRFYVTLVVLELYYGWLLNCESHSNVSQHSYLLSDMSAFIFMNKICLWSGFASYAWCCLCSLDGPWCVRINKLFVSYTLCSN